jgi:hypothetical protein
VHFVHLSMGRWMVAVHEPGISAQLLELTWVLARSSHQRTNITFEAPNVRYAYRVSVCLSLILLADQMLFRSERRGHIIYERILD